MKKERREGDEEGEKSASIAEAQMREANKGRDCVGFGEHGKESEFYFKTKRSH